MPAFTNALLSPDEFKEIAPEFDLTGISDINLTSLMSRASRVAEQYVNRNFAEQQYVDEECEWRPSRRAYVRQWPVQSIDAARFILGATAYATLQPSYFVINNTQRYLELSQLALAATLTPDLLTLGLVEPILAITYTAGFPAIPEEIKEAVAIITAARIAQRRMVEQGIAGYMAVTIGSYTVTVSRPRGASGREDSELAGFAGFMPPEAQEILANYRMTNLR